MISQEVETWLASCPAPLTVTVLVILFHTLLHRTIIKHLRGSLWATPTQLQKAIVTPPQEGFATPQCTDNGTANGISSGGFSSGGSNTRERGNTTDRPLIQKRTGYRNSVLNTDPYTADLLKSFDNLEGCLKKKGQGIVGWQKRYFVIDSAYMKYYDYSKDKINKGNHPLAAIDIRQMKSVTLSVNNNAIFNIELVNSSKTYSLKADSVEVASSWCKNLNARRNALIDVIRRSSSQDSVNVFVSPKKSNRTSAARRESATLTPRNVMNVSDAEFQGLGKMKEKFPNVDSATLLRFLRARKLKVADANEMLLSHLKWRKETFPISLDESVKEQIAREKYILRGRDKDGDVVIYIHGHNLGEHTYNTIEEHMRSVFYLLEFVYAEIMEDPLDRFTIVYNRTHSTPASRDEAWVKNIAKTLADQYPERMKRAIVVPSNIVFRTIWNIIKHFFDPVTAAKISMIASKKELLNFIDKDQLLVELGGTDDYKFDISHLFTREMISEESRSVERISPKAQLIYDIPE